MSQQTYASTLAENGLKDVSGALMKSATHDTGLEKGLSSFGESLRGGISDAASKFVLGAIVIALIWGSCKYLEIKDRRNRRSEDRSHRTRDSE
ncbi:MAG: hypothetical protein MHM6MM_000201 [Cercozoa sp. M6MM]